MHGPLKKFNVYSDEELMHYIINGEEAAFEEIYSRYCRPLLGYFTRMLNYDRKLAEDALQDLFLKIAEDPCKFDKNRSFKTWVYTIASNQCKNFYRHINVVTQKEEEIRYLNSDISENEFILRASKLDGVQFNRMLQKALDLLPAEKKEVFILRYQEDKNLEEIALIQECAVGTVKSRLHYTLKVLEQELQHFNPNK